jgi:hypothetical protein
MQAHLPFSASFEPDEQRYADVHFASQVNSFMLK